MPKSSRELAEQLLRECAEAGGTHDAWVERDYDAAAALIEAHDAALLEPLRKFAESLDLAIDHAPEPAIRSRDEAVRYGTLADVADELMKLLPPAPTAKDGE